MEPAAGAAVSGAVTDDALGARVAVSGAVAEDTAGPEAATAWIGGRGKDRSAGSVCGSEPAAAVEMATRASAAGATADGSCGGSGNMND